MVLFESDSGRCKWYGGIVSGGGDGTDIYELANIYCILRTEEVKVMHIYCNKGCHIPQGTLASW